MVDDLVIGDVSTAGIECDRMESNGIRAGPSRVESNRMESSRIELKRDDEFAARGEKNCRRASFAKWKIMTEKGGNDVEGG